MWLAVAAVMLAFLSFAPLSEGRVGKDSKTTRPSAPGPVSDNAILAVVNGETVRVSQLREWMGKTDLRHARAFAGEEEARKIAFRELVNERLIVQHMRREGKTKSGEFQARIKALRAISLGNWMLAEYRKEHVPSGEEMRSLLPPAFRDLDLRIFFGATFEETTEVRESVLGGKDMERLVRERSVGPAAEDGGLIREYRSKTYIPEHIERGAYSSGKGWVSPVFDTPLGYAFIRVEESRDLPPEDVSRTTEGVILWAKETAGARKVEQEILRAKVSMEEEKVRELDALHSSQWKPRFQEIIARVNDEPVRVEELYWFIYEGTRNVFPEPGSGEVPQLLDTLAKYLAVGKDAVARKVDRDPSFRKWIEAKSDRILMEMYFDRVDRTVQVSGKEAREYFRKNRDAWKNPPGREIREVQAPDRKMALGLLEQLKEHPDQIDRFAADPGKDAKGGKGLVLYRGRMEPEDEKRVFEAPVGKLVGPFPRGKFWSLIIVDREVPPVDNPTFEDHAEEAKARLRQEKLKSALKQKTDELYRKATVLTYTEVLKSVDW